MEKICKKCGNLKSLEEFGLRSDSKDGHTSYCRLCKKEYDINYHLGVRKKIIIKGTKKCTKCLIELDLKFFNKSNKMKDGYKSQCRECQKREAKGYRENNKEKLKKDYKEKFYNKEKEAKRKRIYTKKNPHIFAWRSVLKSSLMRLGTLKEGKTINLLGYSALDLRIHMETLFVKGMTWDNHGEWHIDHKKPVSSFSPDTPPNIVNALSNLQPLWAKDNIIKSNKQL